MKYLISLVVLVSVQSFGYEVGTAPFCVMDNFGNTECYYYDLHSCKTALQFKLGSDYVCVRK